MWLDLKVVKLFRFLSGSSPKRDDSHQQQQEAGAVPDDEKNNNNINNSNNELHQPLGQQQMSQHQMPHQHADNNQRPTLPSSSSLKHLNSDISDDGNSVNVNNIGVKHQLNVKHTSNRKHHSTTTSAAPSSKISRLREPLIDTQLLLTASDYKNAGNKLCSLYRFEEAISYYSKAISKNPEIAIFYSNRALCHLKLQQWPRAIQDCRRALELDSNLIKAHFFLGQALSETFDYDEALKHLQIAHELAKEMKMNFGDDITYQIRLIKRQRWNRIEEEEEHLEDELQNYLVDLVIKDKESKLKKLIEHQNSENEASSSAGVAIWQPTASSSAVSSICKEGTEEVRKLTTTQQKDPEVTLTSKCDKYIDKLETMFNNLKLQRKKREVPDYLCGKISFEIMHDPVITPSGITYDRQDIEEHLKRVGHFDPITRQPLDVSQLISNLAMKEVVDSYLNENEWALYY